jgi:hypothetical protein
MRDEKWLTKAHDEELDGYPVFSPEGLAAIATNPEYAALIVNAVNAYEPKDATEGVE